MPRPVNQRVRDRNFDPELPVHGSKVKADHGEGGTSPFAIATPGVGRPRLNRDLIDQIEKLVTVGNYVEVACAAVGVSVVHFRRWYQAGEYVATTYPDAEIDDEVLPQGVSEQQWLCFEFYERLRIASAQAEVTAMLMVRKHMPDQWTAAMTFLERRFPDRWRRRQTTELTGNVQVEFDEDALIADPHAVDLLHQALEHAARAPGPVVQPVDSGLNELALGEASDSERQP